MLYPGGNVKSRAGYGRVESIHLMTEIHDDWSETQTTSSRAFFGNFDDCIQEIKNK